jgi:hypothetical protein
MPECHGGGTPLSELLDAVERRGEKFVVVRADAQS